MGVVVASCTGGDFGLVTGPSQDQIRRGRTGGGTVGKRLAGNGLRLGLHCPEFQLEALPDLSTRLWWNWLCDRRVAQQNPASTHQTWASVQAWCAMR